MCSGDIWHVRQTCALGYVARRSRVNQDPCINTIYTSLWRCYIQRYKFKQHDYQKPAWGLHVLSVSMLFEGNSVFWNIWKWNLKNESTFKQMHQLSTSRIRNCLNRFLAAHCEIFCIPHQVYTSSFPENTFSSYFPLPCLYSPSIYS